MTDFHPDATAKPLHVTISYNPDGSLNSSCGVVASAVLPSGREQPISREVALSEADVASLGPVLGKALHQALEEEGISGLWSEPEPAKEPTPTG